MEESYRELAYRVYITDSLFSHGQGKRLSKRWIETLDGMKTPVEHRSGEEVTADIRNRWAASQGGETT